MLEREKEYSGHPTRRPGEWVVIGACASMAQADRAARQLLEGGVPSNRISVAAHGKAPAAFDSDADTKAVPGAVVGGAAGAVLGGVIGLAALAVPGIGPILAAGPLAAAAAAALGALTGGAVGSLAGSFQGLGVPTREAKDYASTVERGGVVIAVDADSEGEANGFADLLRRSEASDVAVFPPS